MKSDKLLEMIATIANRRLDQAKFLFNLCGEDMNLYIKLESSLKKRQFNAIPGDKESLDLFLETEFSAQDKEFPLHFRFQSTYFYKESIERYILKTIKEIEIKFEDFRNKKDDYSTKDYWALFHRYSSQIDVLNMTLTAHNNNYKTNLK